MREIINCFFHVIDQNEDNYTYTFAVPTDQGIGIRKVTVGFVETQPIFNTIKIPKELEPRAEEIKKWFKQQ